MGTHPKSRVPQAHGEPEPIPAPFREKRRKKMRKKTKIRVDGFSKMKIKIICPHCGAEEEFELSRVKTLGELLSEAEEE